MRTERLAPAYSPDASPISSKNTGSWAWLVGLSAAGVAVCIGWNARNHPDARVGNPAVSGPFRPVRPLFNFDHWIAFWEIFAAVLVAVLVGLIVWGWRRYGPHPYILMALVTSIIVWQDPIMNWAPYAAYNPRMWHFPESWPLVSISPTIEPLLVFGYAWFQFGPYFPAVWTLRKIQGRRSVDSFAWRHPLISLGLLIFVFGFIFDMFLEIALVQTGLYVYTQVVPFGSIFKGTAHQFPLLWESSLVTLVMVSAGILVYRDDTGRTVSEKLAQRARILPTRPALASFLVMLVIVNLAYLMYGATFTAIKWTRIATSVGCPWAYPDAKAFDPQGFLEENGQEGPYSPGIWSTYMSGQPDGRPTVRLGSKSARCAGNNQA